ncbi:MAG TPA: hypothetical protein VKN64_01615 [Halanaerobiales bacterium]|nr:hypothetical protein [Halanaerobiales bacterium]
MEEIFSRIISALVHYKEYKQRLKIIDTKLKSLSDRPLRKSINKTAVQTSNRKDYTAEIAVDRLEGKLKKEYKSKQMFIKKVEIAREGLDPVEKIIIDEKYLKGRILPDVDIYTHPKFIYGKTKYYEIKSNALTKLGRIMGINNKKSKK